MPELPTSPKLPSLRVIGPGVAGLFSLALFLSLPLLPLLGIFIAILAPLPLLHLVSTGRPSILAWGWVAVVLVGAALTFHTPWLVAVSVGFLLVAAWPAVSIEVWLRHQWSCGRWAGLVAVVALGVVAGVLVAFAYPQAPAERVGAVMARGAHDARQLMGLVGRAGGDNEELLDRMLALLAYLVPAATALYVLAAALWLRPRLAMLGLPRGGEPFARYASEEWLPLGFAVGGLGWVFATGLGKWLATNLFVVVLGLYFVHGLAIIHHYLGRLARNRWVRLGVALFALQLPVALVLSVLGLVDNFFSLRRAEASDGGDRE